MKLIITESELSKDPTFEFVERKGRGHPDTLSDGLAEYLSIQYSRYTLERFGAILHHNFDKVGLLGGASLVRFGEGRLTNPIRVLLNGRASTSFAETVIPVQELLYKWSSEFLKRELPLIDPARDLTFLYHLSTQSSPGKTEENDIKVSARKFWFQPRGLNDIPELRGLFSNDTSLGVGYAPNSSLEQFVLTVERHLNADSFREKHPWMGSDIKLMGFRNGGEFNLTLCIPQIANHVHSSTEYHANMAYARELILSLAHDQGIDNLLLFINTRDSEEKGEYYLTAIGSSIESGDEGLVGRGNRVNGVISPFRPMSMEGIAGKNPVYHIGKLYYVLAHRIANQIYAKFGVYNTVSLVSQSGRDLLDPWVVAVSVPSGFSSRDQLEVLIRQEISTLPEITRQIVAGGISLC